MICAECFCYEDGQCWSRRSGHFGCRMQPEGTCLAASKEEYSDGGVPVQLWTEKERNCDPLRHQQRDPRVLHGGR